MSLAEEFRGERTQATLRELNGTLRYLGDYLVTAQDRDSYEKWVRDLLRPAIQELGWTAAPNNSDEKRALRATVFQTLGYSGHDPQAMEEARKLLRAYLKDSGSVDPTLLHTVFGLAAMQGTPALYDDFVARSQNAGNPETYYRYLQALADFRDPVLLERTLAYALSPAVRSQNAPFLIGTVMQNPAGRDLAWQFLQTHWKALEDKSSLWGMVEIVHFAGSFCSAGAKQEVQQFFGEHPIPAAERGVRQTLEDIQNCADLKADQEPALATWLSQYGSEASRGK